MCVGAWLLSGGVAICVWGRGFSERGGGAM